MNTCGGSVGNPRLLNFEIDLLKTQAVCEIFCFGCMEMSQLAYTVYVSNNYVDWQNRFSK